MTAFDSCWVGPLVSVVRGIASYIWLTHRVHGKRHSRPIVTTTQTAKLVRYATLVAEWGERLAQSPDRPMWMSQRTRSSNPSRSQQTLGGQGRVVSCPRSSTAASQQQIALISQRDQILVQIGQSCPACDSWEGRTSTRVSRHPTART